MSGLQTGNSTGLQTQNATQTQAKRRSQKYALVSVSDKSNLDVLVKALAKAGYSIISTGGTYKAISEILKKHDLKCNLLQVSEITKSPEMLDGRVKTLHPMIHGSLLYRRDKHAEEAKKHDLLDIDIVAINLYPFEETVKNVDSTDEDIIENIDIGGPTMLISSVKNHESVAIVVNPDNYQLIADELAKGPISIGTKKMLAAEAINRLADYRSTIAVELTRMLDDRETIRLSYPQGKKLGKYGENWHQQAWLYSNGGLAQSEQLSGIELGYNNYLDMDASFNALLDIKDKPAAAIVKHLNPCGYATAKTLPAALEKAWQGDDVSAYGSIITLSGKADMAIAKFFDDKFIEVLIVPEIDDDALAYLKQKKKNLRIIRANLERSPACQMKSVDGGMLLQTQDDMLYLGDRLQLFAAAKPVDDSGTMRKVGHVTQHKMPDDALGLVEFSIKAVKNLKSNSIVICYEHDVGFYQILGMGCGQPNRVNSVRIAVEKALYNLEKMGLGKDVLATGKVVLCSDAFFPFRDSIDLLAGLGLKNIIQPGGSVRDQEVIDAADEHGMAMIFTGMRHFRH